MGVQAKKLKLIFQKKVHVTSTVFSFYFSPQDTFSYNAGQYLQIYLPHDSDENGTTRYFTIASSPHEEYIMITTKQSEKSTFKNVLFHLQVGTIVEAFGPIGKFTLED